MRIDILTLFPEYFDPLSKTGITGRAHDRGLWQLKTWNLRDYVHDVHRTVDDRPYGGGPGMVMLAQPLADALDAARADRCDSVPVVLLAPSGKRFNQACAQSLSESPGAIIICGRYEGIDQRFIDRHVDDCWSVGDFVVSGGEPALMPMLDAAVRLLPGAMQQESHDQDSFQNSLSGLLDSPHFTRPEVWQGQGIPEVLKSGHHDKIARWRREQSLALTLAKRPDLIDKARAAGWLSEKDEAFLASQARA
ncbi:MAG: tRNA (guanosine(37)-N1)-methyltransferase TrmD [Burkholderiaceae bacterium]|nr:tRNA (guanosine(37)-N1)-methyltransferase TrmD [Burkholderiaceae bacterium]MCD8517727.1 tRNA (guanosine(37)-N1)-methyltransferase TrmD [Burkholderiaceae bacterium]MCD8536018.1 tRNA (guanosine(37)-N1)-methyltransferase TrmD [Burkholderiaceae bacterium]MCD8564722.1 tRNA (guanosine(37)-N1)-methyltransferase TrmD [Burkholderiaceae bacterium]